MPLGEVKAGIDTCSKGMCDSVYDADCPVKYECQDRLSVVNDKVVSDCVGVKWMLSCAYRVERQWS